MKKTAVYLLLVLGFTSINAQEGPKWATSGNGIGSGDFLGTINNMPLIFKTNDQARATLGSDGVFHIDNLKITGEKGIKFDSESGISYSKNANNIGTFTFGKLANVLAIPCAAAPQSGLNFMMGGNVQIYDPLNPTTTGLLNLQTWSGGSSIDASVGGNLGAGGLLLNYFCGNDTYINTNNSLPNQGGTIFMGQKVDMGGALKIGYSGNTTFDPNTSIELFNGGNPNWNGIKFITPWNGAKVISISNSNFTKSPFTVYASGKTTIGIKDQNSSASHSNAMLTVYGKVVTTELFITQNTWADYVFSNDYNLPSLHEVESYYKTNKHLMDIPSEKEVVENGVSVGEMNKLLLKKIEELTIYVVEQQKEIDLLKSKVK